MERKDEIIKELEILLEHVPVSKLKQTISNIFFDWVSQEEKPLTDLKENIENIWLLLQFLEKIEEG